MKRGKINNKGQFFIVGAVLIILVLFVMASVSTYTIIKEDPKIVNEMNEDLNRESFEILDYGVYNEENTTRLVQNFIEGDVGDYFLAKTNSANIVFVYGNKSILHAAQYNTINTGNINIVGATTPVENTVIDIQKIDVTEEEGFVKVDITGIDDSTKPYFFELNENEMFYFVVVQKSDEEVFIERNDIPKERDYLEKRPGGAEREVKWT
ncbi:MAG: hypothetical protein ABIH37_01815 [archaeon]